MPTCTCKLFVKCHVEKTSVQMRIEVVNISPLCFPELHATLETLRQWHGQRSGLCSRGALCQSYFFRRQQRVCECLVMFCTPSPSFPRGLYAIFSPDVFVRLKIWSLRSNGPLKTAWRLSAGWIPRQKKQPKKRWEPTARSHTMFFTTVLDLCEINTLLWHVRLFPICINFSFWISGCLSFSLLCLEDNKLGWEKSHWATKLHKGFSSCWCSLVPPGV